MTAKYLWHGLLSVQSTGDLCTSDLWSIYSWYIRWYIHIYNKRKLLRNYHCRSRYWILRSISRLEDTAAVETEYVHSSSSTAAIQQCVSSKSWAYSLLFIIFQISVYYCTTVCTCWEFEPATTFWLIAVRVEAYYISIQIPQQWMAVFTEASIYT